MDALLLSRIQFGANISFHILFPSINVALAWVLLFFKLRYNATGNEAWHDAYRFWVKVFALTFGLGVVSGITMSFQFGTNWPGFMETVGNIAGPLLAYEVLTAFFLEAAFLGIMLFGMSRVPGWLHTLATFLVAFGTLMSAFWILVLNSWMQTPAGFEMRDGVAFATDWSQIIFNPSMPYRIAHMLLASAMTASFLIIGLSAYRWIKGDRSAELRTTLRFAVTMAAVLIPVQIIAGDQHGLNTLEHQPQKIAAMEGNWETATHVPMLLFAIPDEKERRNLFEIGIPDGASLILRHDPAGEVPGLDDYIAEDGTVLHPPVAPVFFSFRIMVGTGVLMLAVSWAGVFFLRRKRGETRWHAENLPGWLVYVMVPMGFSGWLATLAGWYTTEIGRQPWLVDGVLKTHDAVGELAPTMVLSTLLIYLAIYVILLGAYVSVLFYLAGKAARGDHVPHSPKAAPLPAE
ncbi:MAG: cytochrome ubiquinol oxidase subunit I [Marinibacterium sp.]|nr:cytochrome ubiquinol oxidase subunit I [Marinibacterium sp.]